MTQMSGRFQSLPKCPHEWERGCSISSISVVYSGVFPCQKQWHQSHRFHFSYVDEEMKTLQVIFISPWGISCCVVVNTELWWLSGFWSATAQQIVGHMHLYIQHLCVRLTTIENSFEKVLLYWTLIDTFFLLLFPKQCSITTIYIMLSSY
jgi:hypothetical protein